MQAFNKKSVCYINCIVSEQFVIVLSKLHSSRTKLWFEFDKIQMVDVDI